MTPNEIESKLIAFMRGKTVVRAAREIGISHEYLHDILNGRRSMTCPAILKKFGLQKVVKYEKKAP